MSRVLGSLMRLLYAGVTVIVFALAQDIPAQEKTAMQMARDAIDAGYMPDLIALLKGGLDPNSIDQEGLTLITYAVMADRDDIVETLLSNGANPNTDGGLALALAALSDNFTAVKALVEKGADVNAQAGLYHSAPLHWACKNGNLDMTAFLLERGAQIEAINSGGWTPLLAASSKNPDVVRLLLSKGAQVDRRDGYGYTSLMYAAKSGNVETIRVLLNAGANTTLQAPDGETAATLALKSKSKEALGMLYPAKGEAAHPQAVPGGTPAPPGPNPGKSGDSTRMTSDGGA